jgi:hypothetical protein
LVNKLLSDDQETAIRDEIADYQNDPSAYIADLTRQQLRDVPIANAKPLMEKGASIKNKIRTFYDNTLNALIADLRIFSISNLIAGLIAFGLAYRSSSDIRKPIVSFSFLMFVAVLYCSYLYVDDLTFFRILFRTHMGWWYAALLCVMIVALYLDYGRHANATEQSDARGAADDAGFEIIVFWRRPHSCSRYVSKRGKSMQYNLIAAAGLAEAAWMMALMLMGGGLFVICIIALFALTLASKKMAIAAIIMLGLFTLFFQPWYCFTPFGTEAYDDPDVVSAAVEFRVVGTGWILTTLFVLIAAAVVWRRSNSTIPKDAAEPPV